jgi:hypothetical protein
LFAARHRPAKESRGTAKKYQRCVRMSRCPPQLRWPKVFGRVESLDWRGLRDTSRSDRCLSMTPQRGNYDLRMLDVQRMLVARRRLQFTAKPGRFSGAGGGSFAYNHHGRDIDPRKFDHSPSVEQLERPPRSTTEKILPQPGYSRAAGSWTSPQAQRPTICLTERLRDNFGDAKAGAKGKLSHRRSTGQLGGAGRPSVLEGVSRRCSTEHLHKERT